MRPMTRAADPGVQRPKLRRLDRHHLERDGEALLVLRDPQGVAEPVALPAEVGPLLDLLDGTRSAAQIRHSLLFSGREAFDREAIEGLIDDLGAAGLLDDDSFRRRWAALHRAFVDAPRRPPAFADVLYPGDPEALAELLGELLGPARRRLAPGSPLAGVLIPHQPFERAESILAATLVELPPADELDAIVIVGADPQPGLVPFAATAKDFDTPLGPVAADRRRIDRLCERHPWLLQEEIRHRGAVSVELAAILVRYLYGDAAPPILPLLCGQAALLVGEQSVAVDELYASLEVDLDELRVLWIAVAELGHCGPAYGRPRLPDDAADRLQARDQGLLEALARGQLHELQRRCLAEDPLLGPASGAPVLASLARLLPVGYRGGVAAYACQPAPGDEPGLVGLAGVRFAAPT